LIKQIIVLRGIMQSMMQFLPSLLVLVCFPIYDGVIDPLTTAKVYAVITVFKMLSGPIIYLQWTITSFGQAAASFKRIDAFMKLPSHESPAQEEDTSIPKGQLTIKNGFFTLQDLELMKQMGEKDIPEKPKEILSSINLNFLPGSLSVIIGKISSGKSCLLLSLMNEMTTVSGSVKKHGKIAYVPQEAFMMNQTIRENIIGGETWNIDRYNEILDICELRPDLEVLEGYDMTEIGERGINLSGGQKQRISIARAVYADAEIYLIDDALSAVDVYVGKKLFENVFTGKLKEKTVVVVTHSLQYLPKFPNIYLVDEGVIVAQGGYADIKITEAYSQCINQQMVELSKKHSKLSRVESMNDQSDWEGTLKELHSLDKNKDISPIKKNKFHYQEPPSKTPHNIYEDLKVADEHPNGINLHPLGPNATVESQHLRVQQLQNKVYDEELRLQRVKSNKSQTSIHKQPSISRLSNDHPDTKKCSIRELANLNQRKDEFAT
jgi:ABC-type Mn2+/Zn2+ transport system ATPase subunit